MYGIHFDKYCCFRFKDDRHCSPLIAEALDPDCKVSPVRVSNKLKQLGLKIAPKKRMLQVDVALSNGSNQIMEEARAVGERSAVLFNLLQQCRGKFSEVISVSIYQHQYIVLTLFSYTLCYESNFLCTIGVWALALVVMKLQTVFGIKNIFFACS